jgi:membrane associated rhomboid family serine protease
VIPFKDNIATEQTPVVSLVLILANVVVYVVATSQGGSLISGPDAHELATFAPVPAIFLQASIVALAGNMLFL